MAEDVDGRSLEPFIAACDQYPYHELVAYACGRTIGELRDWLERGAAASADTPNLTEFAREYCRKDAEYGARTWKLIEDNCKAGAKGNVGPLWKWFDIRWPCGNPLAITTLLAGQRVEVLTLEQSFADPSQPIRDALTATGWLHIRDLDNPSAELERALTEAGYRRESDARPGPRPTEEG